MLPTHWVLQQFDLISKQLHSESESFDSFFSYFRQTYIKSKRFPMVAWNHDDYLGTRPRTNNHVEGCLV